MHYLRGNATASAVGLYVIWRYLNSAQDGRTEEDVQRALEILRTTSPVPEQASAVLSASLSVGEGLGVLTHETHTETWKVDQHFSEDILGSGDPWPRFRGALSHRMMQQGLEQLESGDAAPDLVLGLAWFMQFSPLSPIHSSWTEGPEPHVLKSGFRAVSSPEQWRSFQRWASALGFSRTSDQGKAKVTIPDATTAIQ
ncbi:hypothetical protein JZU54_04285, partial [bacterium]|nr:hypothetical protein [bacterium]